MARFELPPHVQALLRREAYPEPLLRRIELVQTHISYVFLADERVFKVKKAVDLGFLDFSTLERRKAFCEAEVRLNRRGCSGDVYRGVVPLTKEGQGYRLGGSGEVVDYAVEMKRLPAERMMDRLLAQDAVSLEMIGRLAARLADLHRNADRSAEITAIGGAATFRANWQENLDFAREQTGTLLSARRLARLEKAGLAFFAREAALLRSREDGGWIRDCHGDLRSDAVCFDDSLPEGVCLLDCIEFSDRLRYSDTALDVGFLVMDLHYRGRPDLADLLAGLYAPLLGDSEIALLLPFYAAYRATVRAKVEGLLSIDKGVSRRIQSAARARSRRYYRLAEALVSRRPYKGLVMVMGLSGSGKSVLAGALASRLGAVLLSTDATRRTLFESGRDGAALDTGIYAPDQRQQVYDAMLAEAERELKAGLGVVLDGTFIERQQREPFLKLAAGLGVRTRVIECVAEDRLVKQRQERRAGQAWTTSEGRWEVYLAQKQHYQRPDEVSPSDYLRVDTAQEAARQLEAVEGYLAG